MTAAHHQDHSPPHIRTGTADYYITDDVVKMIERIGGKVWVTQVMDGRI